MFKRPVYNILYKRILEPRKFIQVMLGPRQTGKTTLAHQLMEGMSFSSHYASADEPALKDLIWIEQQWEVARAQSRKGKKKKALLVMDEIQKIPGWSETVKRLWDEDTILGRQLLVIILGSSSLLVQQGLSESLAGRFELIPVTHWSYSEMKAGFGWDCDTYIFYGGYPGAASLIGDHHRWVRYIVDSLIETTVSRDILLMRRVDKPALLRRLFELGCTYSGQVLSYQKMLGQLQDAGNTTTLAHYLELLDSAGLLTGLQKYSGHLVRRRSSSPKLQVLNSAFISALSQFTFEEARNDPEKWGRMVESSVGALLANGITGSQAKLYYWSSRNREVDFVLHRRNYLVAVEVKSGNRKTSIPGIKEFAKVFKVNRKLLVGAQGIPVEEFLRTPPLRWLASS